MTTPALQNREPLSAWQDQAVALELGHAVDAAAVEELRDHLRSITIAPRRLDLDCASVRSVDPVGAALLWLLCSELERRVGTRVMLVQLQTGVAQRLRSHPLLQYVMHGEELFQDPFSSLGPSDR